MADGAAQSYVRNLGGPIVTQQDVGAAGAQCQSERNANGNMGYQTATVNRVCAPAGTEENAMY